jgi:hypothetical protein
VGSAQPVEHPRFVDGRFVFTRQLTWRPFGDETRKRIAAPFVATWRDDDRLELSFQQVTVDSEQELPETVRLLGERISSPPRRPDLAKVAFGAPWSLFNGEDLTGWRLANPRKKNGWRVEQGMLINETPKEDFGAYGEYGNLVTEQEFTDFELTIDYNVEQGGNSGVYLRGMYEAQVVERDSPMQGISGPGAIFGRLAPTRNVGKSGGQWNTYRLTLVDRHVTVELNGEKVIDNALLAGCTGGGIQSHDDRPGPILLQGDHTSVRYRNIHLRPVVTNGYRNNRQKTE